MANLSIRKLDDKVYEELRVRALKHGISLEQEVRQILIQAVTPLKISKVFKKHFGPKNGIELKLETRNKPHNPLEFDK